TRPKLPNFRLSPAEAGARADRSGQAGGKRRRTRLWGMAMADVVSVEEELVLRLAGVAAVRARESDRMRELARRADADELLRLLRRQRLVTLLGSRLLETSDDLVPGPVR